MIVGNTELDIKGVKFNSASITSKEAIQKAGLNWSVETVQYYLNNEPANGKFANCRSDTKECLGDVSARYKIYQNKYFFTLMDNIKSKFNNSSIDSAGMLFNGEETWMKLKVGTSNIFDDTIIHYFFMMNSFTGKTSCLYGITSMINNYVITLNTKQSRVWSFKHTGDKDREEESNESVTNINNYMESMNKTANRMYEEKIDARAILKKIFAIAKTDSDRIAGNTQWKIETVMNLYNTDTSIFNYKDTAWGLYLAIAKWKTESDALRKTETYNDNKFREQLIGIPELEKLQKLTIGY